MTISVEIEVLGEWAVKEVIIALVSSSITIIITSFFNYHFQLMKEIRNEAVKYKTEILKNVYTPCIKNTCRGYCARRRI